MVFDIDINILETVIRTLKTATSVRSSFAILNKTCVTADEEEQSVTFIAHIDSHKQLTPVSVTVFAPYVVVYEDGVALLDLSAKTVKFAATEKKSNTAYVCVSDNAILIKDGSYLRQIIAQKGDISDYPSVETPSRSAKTVGYIDVGRLKLANVYSSEDTVRTDFVGVAVTERNAHLALVSTDGHRLGAFTIEHYHGEPLDLEALPKGGIFFIPTAWVKTIVDSRADRIRLDVDNGEKKFRLTAQLQDGVKFDLWGRDTEVLFPDFTKVIPPVTDGMTRYILEGNPKTLSDICKTELANICKNRTFAIRKDGSTIKRTDSGVVETPIRFTVEPGADFNGQPIGINLGYIKDTLDIIASEWKSTVEIVFYTIDQDMPVTVIANGDESMTHVLMPMQV